VPVTAPGGSQPIHQAPKVTLTSVEKSPYIGQD
jgi:hypothetical protein